MTGRAESVLPLIKPMPWMLHSAVHYVTAGYQEKARVGYVTEALAYPGLESFVPSHHYGSLSVTMGPWLTKLVEYSLSGKQLDKFVDQLLGKPGRRTPPSSSSSSSSSSSLAGAELSDIHRELQIEARATGQPELYVYLNFLDNYQRFYTIDAASVRDALMRQSSLSGGAPLKYHKYVPLLDSLVRVPSSMGLAYTVVVHNNIFVSLQSDVRGGFDINSKTLK